MHWNDPTIWLGYGQLAVLLGAGLWSFVRWKLNKGMTPLREHNLLKAEVAAMQQRLSRLPTHEDINAMVNRLSGVESKLASQEATLVGIKDAMGGVGHQLSLIMTHLLEQKS